MTNRIYCHASSYNFIFLAKTGWLSGTSPDRRCQKINSQRSYRCQVPFLPPSFQLYVCEYLVICDGVHLFSNVSVHVCACMHGVLDLGLWCISAQETRGPCGPLMGMELSKNGGMLKGTQSERIPLRCSTCNSHTHETLQTFTALSIKHKQNMVAGVWYRNLAWVERMHMQMQHLCWLYTLL